MYSSPFVHVEAPAWISGLLTHVWQSTAVALGILLLLALARGLSARTRLGLAWLGLAKFALPAVWLAHAVAWLRAGFSAGTDAGAIVGAVKFSAPAANPFVSAADWTIPAWACVTLALVWLLGTLALLTGWSWRASRTRRRLLAGTMECRPELALRIAWASEQVGLSLPPRCLVGEAGNGPGVLGVRSPVIILPRGLAETLTAAEFASVLLHECVHLRRRDNLRNALSGGLVALFWFNPLVWILHRAIGVETEKSCDERVLELTGDADAYAAGIVACVQHNLGISRPVFAGVATPPVVERIRGILAYPIRRERPMAHRAVLLGGLALVAFGGRAGSIAAETAPLLPRGSAPVAPERNAPPTAEKPDVPKTAARPTGTLVLGSSVGTLSLSGEPPVASRAPTVDELKKFFEGPKVEEAVLLRPVAPRYPAAARDRGQGGQVMLSVLIDSSGTVARARVVSLTDPIFEEPALEAVKRWAYQPVRIDGAPTMATITVPVDFRPETSDGPASVRLPGPTPVQTPALLAGPATSPSLKSPPNNLRPRFRFIPSASLARSGTVEGTVHELSAVNRPPVAQFQARPRYPFQMRKQGITGDAVVDFVVNQEGEVVNAVVTRSSREEFELPALDAVSKWRFRPGEKDGRAVNTHMQVPIVFTINPS